MNYILFLLFGAILGALSAFAVLKYLENKDILEAKKGKDKILKDAELEKNKKIESAEKKAAELINSAKKENIEILSKSEKLEKRLFEREEKLEKKIESIDSKKEDLIRKEEILQAETENVVNTKYELEGKLSEIANLTEDEARELFLSQISEKYKTEAISLIEKERKKIEEKKQEISREILIKSMQQYAGDVTSEVTTTVIDLPSDDIKGRLIGKEGRNITAFERSTGVSLIIDDTPDTVFISAFDLFRRYIAKKSLEKLIEDGRIQPARIEDVVEKITEDAGILLKGLGQKTVEDLGITALPDEILSLVGKLRFRTSYGQNILKHSIEVAYIAEQIAKDLGVDPMLVKKGGLLHDLGKALDHDIEGTHPEIGARIARKHGLNEKVVDMIENHHGDQFSISIEAAIVQLADAISSVRPGARREDIEQYIKRIQELEGLVQSFSGVNKAYAVSAGREVRVFVDADTISDMDALNIARDIANKVEEELKYPGEVKINLIREKRVIEYAK